MLVLLCFSTEEYDTFVYDSCSILFRNLETARNLVPGTWFPEPAKSWFLRNLHRPPPPEPRMGSTPYATVDGE